MGAVGLVRGRENEDEQWSFFSFEFFVGIFVREIKKDERLISLGF